GRARRHGIGFREGRRKHRARVGGFEEHSNADGSNAMIMLAKVALGFAGTLAVAGAYTFREGVLRVDVDEYRDGGSHVHLWLPAAAVPMVMDAVPRRHFIEAARQAQEWMPVARIAIKE